VADTHLELSRRAFLRSGAIGAAGTALAPLLARVATAAGPATGGPAAASARPNILFILADDLGFECLGSYGGAYSTPNLDRLAGRGMRFTNVFACPVCSPARAQFLTGQYNFRSGFIDIAGRNGAVAELDVQRFPTIAQHLKAAGYATAVCGKWHVGWTNGGRKVARGAPSPHVTAAGFDEQFCFQGANIENYGKPEKGTYMPDQHRAWVLKYLEGRKSNPQPFFMYYAMGIPHSPWMPTPLHPDRPRSKSSRDATANNALFADMVEYMDLEVGEIVAKLKDLGMEENTIVAFAGDNGTDAVLSPTLNGKPVKTAKNSLRDAGSWVPLLVAGPGVKTGVSEDLVDFTDLFPTFAALAKAPVKVSATLDGVSIAPQLAGQRGEPRSWVHVAHVRHYFTRNKKYKLMDTGELYDISQSPFGEKKLDTLDAEAQAGKDLLAAAAAKLHPA